MAAQVPDPRHFKSWEDAFQHPLPAVRKFEQQLRGNAAEDREKLRSLVGASYRSLLETAERICEMDEKMQSVETTLGSTAVKCNSAAVEKIFSNSARLAVESQSQHATLNSMAAQLAMLKNCQGTMALLIKQDRSTYAAAKVLVLARLLYNTLSQQVDAPPLVESVRKRIGSLRTKLLNGIDRNFSNPELESQEVVSNMCAFCLATSSSPADVLQHFLQTRTEAIRRAAASPRGARENMIKAIKLFKGSFAVVHTVFPRRLAEALSKLKLQPLLQDKEVQSLSGLNLDVLGRWIAKDVQNFTPWPRHDELNRPEADKLTRARGPALLSSVKDTFTSILEGQHDFEKVLKLREDVIEAHLGSIDRTPGHDPSDLLDVIRATFNARLSELVGTRVQGLLALSRKTASVLELWHQPVEKSTNSLWGLADEDRNLERGAFAFKEAVRDRVHGSRDEIKACIAISGAWATSISEARDLIKAMKEKRWEDDILGTAVDAEDTIDLDATQALLGGDDPAAVETALSSTLNQALADFRTDFGKLSASAETPAKAIFLLRILRDLADRAGSLKKIDLRHQSLSQQLYETIAFSVSQKALEDYAAGLARFARAKCIAQVALWEGNPPLPTQPSPSAFRLLNRLTKDMAIAGQDIWASGLLNVLQAHVSGQIAASFQDAITEAQKTTVKPPVVSHVNGKTTAEAHGDGSDVNGTALAEDAGANGVKANGVTEHENEDTQAGTQAKADSEAKAQAEAGSDTEDRPEPKAETEDPVQVSAESEAQLENKDGTEAKSEGDTVLEEPDNTALDAINESVRTDKHKQLLFDIIYLQRIFAVASQGTNPSQSASHKALQAAMGSIKEGANAEGDAYDRTRKSAVDYWRKTYLLFGLLAS